MIQSFLCLFKPKETIFIFSFKKNKILKKFFELPELPVEQRKSHIMQ